MSVVFIRAVILYVLLIFTVRLMGKRQIGELQPSELAITILISNIATLPVEDTGIPLLTGIIPIVTLAGLDVIMSWLGIKSRTVRRFTCGKPVIIISGGQLDQKKMQSIRFTVDDLAASLRSQGIFDISEVQLAVVETTGTLSVYQKYSARNVTNGDMEIKGKNENPPEVVVADGELVPEAMGRLGVTPKWIEAALKKENAAIKDVFLMTAYPGGKCSIMKKSR
ncbi:MAG: DUF421 domain-containing protein [Oscillospiraceae bacterium]|nr:DUF421 domain-containing protein [Oscillospiraceae bacterium]